LGFASWIDFAFRKIFGKPGNEICLISLLNAVLRFPHPVVSVEQTSGHEGVLKRATSIMVADMRWRPLLSIRWKRSSRRPFSAMASQ